MTAFRLDAQTIFDDGFVSPIPGESQWFNVNERLKSGLIRSKTVKRINFPGEFDCQCPDFQSLSICHHALAVAKSQHEERDFVDKVRDKMEEKSLRDVLEPKIRSAGGGQKPGSRRRCPASHNPRTVFSIASASAALPAASGESVVLSGR